MASKLKLVLSGAVSLVALICASPALAPAATINVTTTADQFDAGSTGPCSLREAIEAANTMAPKGGCPAGESGLDTINLPGGTYPIGISPMMPFNNSTGDFEVAGTATIQAVAGAKVVIDGALQDRVFLHSGMGTLTMSNLTIRRGNAVGVSGGGIYNSSNSTLVLQNVTLDSNSTTDDGGGIANEGELTATNVTISGNRAAGNGGGIYNGFLVNLTNVTVAGNTADSEENSTGDGGGIANDGWANIDNSILADNVDSSPSSANQKADCAGSGPAFFNVLIERTDSPECAATFEDSNVITGQDPSLGPLADNGGPVPTLALSSGSVAIDKGSSTEPNACAPADARGIARPQGAGCDLGAFERAPSDDPPPPPPPDDDDDPTPGKCAGKTATKTGTAGRDVIKGTKGRDVIAALGGNDKITGLGGNDLICGGTGNDTLIGGAGKDTLRGDAGNDKLLGGAAKDLLVGAKGKDKLFGGAGKDTLRGGPGKDTQKP